MDLGINQKQLSSIVVHLPNTRRTTRRRYKTPTAKWSIGSTRTLIIMGACMGRCLLKKQSSCIRRRHSTDEQETELMPDDDDKKRREKLIFRIIKFKRKQKRKQFIDNFWERQDLNYSRLNRTANCVEKKGAGEIQLQNLDAQTLLVNAAAAKESKICCSRFEGTSGAVTGSTFAVTSSRASSSLDLEWEHEYGNISGATNSRHGPGIRDEEINELWHFMSDSSINGDANGINDDQHNSLSTSPPPPAPLEATSSAVAVLVSTITDDQYRRCNGYLPKILVKGLSSSRSGPLVDTNGKIGPSFNGSNGNFTRTHSHTSWSHISTPESLEWDIDEDQQNQMHVEDDNLDHDTLELLHQIELLKNKVLNETGEGLLENGAIAAEEDSINGADRTS